MRSLWIAKISLAPAVGEAIGVGVKGIRDGSTKAAREDTTEGCAVTGSAIGVSRTGVIVGVIVGKIGVIVVAVVMGGGLISG